MAIETKTFHIGGMTCVNCEARISAALNAISGVTNIRVNYRDEEAQFDYDSEQITLKEIASAITAQGYEILARKQRMSTSNAISILIIIVGFYFFLEITGILNMLAPSSLAESGMGYGMLFVTGLITSVHCIAMCGGINLSQCLPRAYSTEKPSAAFKPALLYNLGRVVSYTVMGCIAGSIGMFLGSAFESALSMIFQGGLKVFAGLFMIIMGLGMSGLFAGLRISFPKSLSARIHSEKRRGHGAFIVGLLNGIMPCGPLQSMWLVALGAAHPVSGTLSMLLFSLGTVPLMLGLGALVTALGQKFNRIVMLVGSILVIVLGLAMCSQGAALTGMISTQTLNAVVVAAAIAGAILYVPAKSRRARIAAKIAAISLAVAAILVPRFVKAPVPTQPVNNVVLQNGKQVVHSTLKDGLYPNILVQAGYPVQWIIDVKTGDINGCNNKMVIPQFNIEHTFQLGQNIIEFTPTTPGTIPYSCWMGMIKAWIVVQ